MDSGPLYSIFGTLGKNSPLVFCFFAGFSPSVLLEVGAKLIVWINWSYLSFQCCILVGTLCQCTDIRCSLLLPVSCVSNQCILCVSDWIPHLFTRCRWICWGWNFGFGTLFAPPDPIYPSSTSSFFRFLATALNSMEIA